jgi:hypothetical protein
MSSPATKWTDLQKQVEGEKEYQSFSCVIPNANVIMLTYEDKLLGDVQVYPEKRTVEFSAKLLLRCMASSLQLINQR